MAKPKVRKFTSNEVARVLAEIQASIPKNLLENVVRNVKISPTIEKVAIAAINSPDYPAEKKEQVKNLYEAGAFSKTHPVENPRIAKMIDNYVSRKINQAIKEGRLPRDGTPFAKDIYEKIKNTKNEPKK